MVMRTFGVKVVGLVTGAVVKDTSKKGAGEVVSSDDVGTYVVGITCIAGDLVTGDTVETGEGSLGSSEGGEVVGTETSTGALVSRGVIAAVGELVSGEVPSTGRGVITGGMLGIRSSEAGDMDNGKTMKGAVLDGVVIGLVTEGETVSGTPEKRGLDIGTALFPEIRVGGKVIKTAGFNVTSFDTGF